MLAFAVREAAVAAEPPCAPAIAELVSAQGSIEIRRLGEAKWQPARLGDTLCAGDRVRVKERSRAALAMTNEIVMRLDEQTTVTLLGLEAAQPSLLELCRGAIHFFTRYRKTFRVITPFVNAAVEGTELSIDHIDVQDNISVYEGQVMATNEPTRLLPETCEDLPRPAPIGGSLILTSGESAVVPLNQAPSKLALVARPEDAVQWALYYPPIVDYGVSEEAGAPGSAVRESIELYRQGKIAEAISRIESVPESARDPRFLNYRAGLLLLVGRVDEARPDIEQALQLDPRNSEAYALQAIISVVQNQKGEALVLATKAVELDPKSSAARIALSYAQQANFQIEQALESVKETVALDPKNALAWARLAELEMSTGNLDRALAAAERAASLNPNLVRTQTVLGFAHLTRIDMQAARTSFTRAIELDQADPLPRLGLGLAKIRESDLEEGRREIEIATSLDPAASLTRSYLGKAYYEEKRDELAGTQYDLAKALDPRDPTPWFYDAIRKQTINRPVEALEDLEESIKLNDNRAVYRSRLLLDEDRAARESSLARIYDDLGFDQLALVEASKSLSLDPASYSAHRFLSDTYATLPRHEIARVSELLQAQLLQPLNINPVQPRLAVTDLNILAAAGPAEAAFNEYSTLFERDRPQLTISGLLGNNGTLGDEAVLSGLNGRMSYSLGQFHYETDGFRENNDLRHDIYNLFAQFAVTPDFNVQAELRQRNTRHGDLTLHFNQDSFSLVDRRRLDHDIERLGLHFSPAPQSDWIVSYIHSDRKENQITFQDEISVTDALEDRGYQAEAQYLFRTSRFNLTGGIGTYRIDSTLRDISDLTLLLGPPCPPDELCIFEDTTRKTRKQENGYVYVNFAMASSLSGTIGLSRDEYEEGTLRLRKWNPKFGLQWKASQDMNFRVAAFDTVKRALVVNQTIEPTQVAGFNQFFDDANGTRAESYGFAVDARLAESLNVGIHAFTRDLEFPIGGQFEDQKEKLYIGYLYWTPYRNWAASAEYRLDTFEREQTVPQDPRPIDLSTIYVPLAIRYFHPSGVFASFAATYLSQRVDRTPTSNFGDGHDKFVLLDAAIGYRLANRRGIISLELRNLLNKKFSFEDENFRTSEKPQVSPIVPDRTVVLRATLSF
jgi:tetratricopeptide (TPR) repeat protein